MSEMSRDPLADKHSPFNQPAFPRVERQSDTPEFVYYGMSLRDYFAAKALVALLSRATEELLRQADPTVADWASREAYLMADAMLKARLT